MKTKRERALLAVAVWAECEAEIVKKEGDPEFAAALREIAHDLTVEAFVLKKRRAAKETT